MTECHVLHPALFALLAPLREVLRRLGAVRRAGSLEMNLLASGADLLLRTDGPLDTAGRTALTAFARETGDVVRLSWALKQDTPETVCLLKPLRHDFSGHPAEPPPGAFLQATQDAEDAIVAAVRAGCVSKRSRPTIHELYAGCGTLSLPLSDDALVVAYEGSASALACLRKAAGGRRIKPVQRDLIRQPVMAKEMAGADVAVLDPPFTGAGPQIAELVAAAPPRIVYVSCNPERLAQELAPLASRYIVETLTVIDQFLWSAHVEGVVSLRRL